MYIQLFVILVNRGLDTAGGTIRYDSYLSVMNRLISYHPTVIRDEAGGLNEVSCR